MNATSSAGGTLSSGAEYDFAIGIFANFDETTPKSRLRAANVSNRVALGGSLVVELGLIQKPVFPIPAPYCRPRSPAASCWSSRSGSSGLWSVGIKPKKRFSRKRSIEALIDRFSVNGSSRRPNRGKKPGVASRAVGRTSEGGTRAPASRPRNNFSLQVGTAHAPIWPERSPA